MAVIPTRSASVVGGGSSMKSSTSSTAKSGGVSASRWTRVSAEVQKRGTRATRPSGSKWEAEISRIFGRPSRAGTSRLPRGPLRGHVRGEARQRGERLPPLGDVADPDPVFPLEPDDQLEEIDRVEIQTAADEQGVVLDRRG